MASTSTQTIIILTLILLVGVVGYDKYLQYFKTSSTTTTSSSNIKIGTIVPYAGTTLPSGFLSCNGNAVSRTDYAALFTAIGTTFGAGNKTTTFNLPDLRGRVVIGNGAGTGLSSYTTGATGGEETHVLTVSEMPAHSHGMPIGGVDDKNFSGNSGQIPPADSNQINSNQYSSNSTGGGSSHNNLQPYAVLAYMIAAT